MKLGVVQSNVIIPAFKPYMQSTRRHQHLMGGGGSGKSVVSAMKHCFSHILSPPDEQTWRKAMLTSMSAYELDEKIGRGIIKLPLFRPYREKLLLLRSQQNLVRNSQFAEMKNIIRRFGLSIKVNDSQMTMECPLNGNQVICAGLRSGGSERTKSLEGLTRIWIEEATDGGITMADIDLLDIRLRHPLCPDPSITLTYNPVHEGHWINQYYYLHKDPATGEDLPQEAIDNMENELFKLVTTYKDNPFLNKKYVQQLENKAHTNPNFYRVYALGQWGGTPEGCIYNNWRKVERFPDAIDEFIYGIDKGFNHPYAIVKIGFLPSKVSIYIELNGKDEIIGYEEAGIYVQQIVYERGLTTRQIIAKYRDILPINGTYFMSPEAAADIAEWNMEGYNVSAADNAVENGISAIKQHRIHVVHTHENPGLDVISELTAYKYKIGTKTGTYSDMINKTNDDAMDAMRYAFYSRYKPNSQTSVDTWEWTGPTKWED